MICSKYKTDLFFNYLYTKIYFSGKSFKNNRLKVCPLGSLENIDSRKYLPSTSKPVNEQEPQENVDYNSPGTSTVLVDHPEPSTSTSSGKISQLDNYFENVSMYSDISSGSAQQEAEMYFLEKENEELKEKLEKMTNRFSFEHIKNSDNLIKMYTGVPSASLFEALFDLFKNLKLEYYHGWTVSIIPKKDQLLLTLMKLRLNLLQTDLACRFNCSRATIANIIYTWILALHEILFKQLMKDIPSRTKNKTCLPVSFSTFTNCRIILDCTEVKVQKPTLLEHQKATYSFYKHMNTFKGLVGVAPNGVVTYCSELYAGSTSDKKIVQNCGILNHLVPGDLILADKGFLIGDLLPEGVNFNIPPFLTTAQFTKEQVLCTRTIARARIHVERAIRRIKCYSILDNISASLASHATEIFQVCAALTNLQYPLIADMNKLMVDE